MCNYCGTFNNCVYTYNCGGYYPGACGYARRPWARPRVGDDLGIAPVCGPPLHPGQGSILGALVSVVTAAAAVASNN
jgi:hypothetical protein